MHKAPHLPHRRRPLAAALCGLCLSLLFTHTAQAEVRLGENRVSVGGKVVNQLVVDRQEGASLGNNARTVLQANTVQRTRVGGNLTLTTAIGTLTQQAQGRGAIAGTAVGTVADTTVGGSLTNTVSVGSSTNIAIGAGAFACTEIGTFGRHAACR